MKKQKKNNVQNQFSAYLVTSIKHKRAWYMERKYRLQEREYISESILESSRSNFEDQFQEYLNDQVDSWPDQTDIIRAMLELAAGRKLLNAVNRLKDKELLLLAGRVYGRLSFSELGAMTGKTPKQAEMAYYYIIRKTRREL